MRKLALVGLMVLAPLAAARADIIPTNVGITGGPNYTWEYNAQITSDQTAVAGTPPAATPAPHVAGGGAFWTLYDFAGYVGGSCIAPTGWTCTAQNVGMTPNGVNPVAPPDSGSLVNLTFAYINGPDLVGPQLVTGFYAQSTFNLVGRGSFAARAIRNTPPQNGTIIDNVGNVEIPVPPSSSGVPEPASLALMGIALIGLGAVRRRSRR